MKLLEKLAITGKSFKREKDLDILRSIRLAIPAQSAAMTPPLGPSLGQFGLNIMEFCRQFNERSALFDSEVMLNVVINLFRNKSFVFEFYTPPISFLVYEYFFFVSKKFDSEALNISDKLLSSAFVYPVKLPLSIFYKIVVICSFLHNVDQARMAKMVFSTLQSMHIILYNDL